MTMNRFSERAAVDCEILVAGKDMFGAAFSETTRMLELFAEGFSFALYRPVCEGLPLRISFHPDFSETTPWVKGVIRNVKNRLDGKQTIELHELEFSQDSAPSGSGLRESPTPTGEASSSARAAPPESKTG